MQAKLWCEPFKTAIDIMNISASTMGDKTRNEKWENRLPDFCKKLRVIGEIGVDTKLGIATKIFDRGFSAMLVGYADQHAKGTYRMLNLQTNKISVTKDVTWLNMNLIEYKKYIDNTKESMESDSTTLKTNESTSSKDESVDSSKMLREMNVPVETVDSNQLEDSNEKQKEEDNVDSDESSDDFTAQTRKLHNELKALGVNLKIPPLDKKLRSRTRARNIINMVIDAKTKSDLHEIAYLINEEQDIKSIFTIIDELKEIYMNGNAAFHSPVESDYKEPKNYRSMLKRPQAEKEKWLEGIQKEFNDIKNRLVWRIVKKKDVAKGRRLIGSKWVFKRKRDGQYRSRLVEWDLLKYLVLILQIIFHQLYMM